MTSLFDHHAAALRPRLRGWFHAAACIAAITLAPIVIVSAPGGSPRGVIALYAGAIVALFGVSAIYHRIPWAHRAREIVKTVDHSMIFVAIAATYTPVAVFGLGGDTRLLLLLVVWIGAGVGVASKILWPQAPTAFAVALYLAVGWAALLVVDDLWRSLGVAGFVLLIVGGVLYSSGAVIYAFRHPDPWPRWFGYHELFHVLVIAAAAVHYVAVTFVALPKA